MKTKVGHMVCLTPECGNRVVVKKNDNGTLSYTCDECDGGGYAKVGQGTHAAWMKRITPVAAPAPAAKETPAPKKPDEKPAPKKDDAPAPKKSGSGLFV